MSKKVVGYHVGDLIICTFCFESHMPPDSQIIRGDVDALISRCDICHLPLGAWEEFYGKWEVDMAEIDHADAKASQERERNLVRLIAAAVQRKLQKKDSTPLGEKCVEANVDQCFELDLEKILNGIVP